jgi:methionine-rich copper-binding protein CopC
VESTVFHHTIGRIVPSIALVAALFAASVSQAEAHAQLRSASPAVGSTVKTPPSEVVITFSEALEPKFSSIAVTDAAGKRVDNGDLRLSATDPKQLIVGLAGVGAGTYTVTWHAVSVDTHRTQGSFHFSVAP